MRALMQPKLKTKITSFDNSTYKIKEKSINTKLNLEFKFYQKLFLIFIASCTFLIFPDLPKNSEVLCKKYYPIEACIIW